MCSFEIAEEFRLDTLEEEILLLEKELSRDDQEVAFCHNDLQYGNIMMNEETRSITLIVSLFFSSSFFGFIVIIESLVKGFQHTLSPIDFWMISSLQIL